jgi:hypothetical protein
MMMAATYPLEVVEAARWVNANPSLKGDQLAIVLEKKDWDPSVKSLVNFPTALAMMDGNLTWTQNLGDAFLAQKDQVMDTLQQLRNRAQAQGNLRTTPEQRVTTRDQMIVVEPADPQVIYVPAYNPSVAYGPWWYPEYPPYYYNPLGYVIGGIINFGVGLLIGAPWGYAWGGFDWYHHGVYCNAYQNSTFNHYINRDRYARRVTPGEGGHGQWRHDPSHRRNVAYRDRRTQENHEQAMRHRPDTSKDSRQNWVNEKSNQMKVGGRLETDRQTVSGRPGHAVPDSRTPAQVQGRTALDTGSPASEKYRANMGQRKTTPEIERQVLQQRRETPRLVASPNRPPMAVVGSAQSYHGSGMMNSSYSSGSATVNPSFRGKAMLQTSYSSRPSLQSSQRATGFTGRSGGGFPGKSGGISGKTQGPFSGRGGNHRQQAG